MSLLSALSTATSAIAAEQTAITVTGNNIANVGNPDYSREVTTLSPRPAQQIQPGLYVGTGVDVSSVRRQVDSALNSRLNSSSSDSSAAQTNSDWIGQVQSTLNALSGNDLSSNLSSFFTGWSNLANNPTDSGQRQVVLQNGANLATYVQGLSGQLNTLQINITQELPQQASNADSLATQIAGLNVQIAQAQGAAGSANNGLLDQRAADLSKLSKLVNISTADQPDGTVNVYIGSQPLVEGQTNHGLTVKNVSDANGNPVPTLVFKNTGGSVGATSGVLGALVGIQSQIKTTNSQINRIAGNLISAVNQLHASGQGTKGFASVTSTNPVTDPTAPLNSVATGLVPPPVNGSFVLHVTQANGTSTSTLVQVNLKGTPTDSTLNSLAASLNAISGVSATVNAGQLTIKSTNATSKLSFSQDSSNALASLGINTFFSGTNAGNISVNSTVANDPTLLSASQNGDPGDNTNALAISQLETKSLTGLNGGSLQSAYQDLVTKVGNSAAAAKTEVTATATIVNTLTAQQQSLSGVSINEETVNLLQQQQAFQAAARVISTVQSMYASLLNAVGGA